jgi:hypothetical protein
VPVSCTILRNIECLHTSVEGLGIKKACASVWCEEKKNLLANKSVVDVVLEVPVKSPHLLICSVAESGAQIRQLLNQAP